MVDLSMSKAYRRINPNSSDENARQMGPKIYGRINVRKEIARLRDERSAKLTISAENVLAFWWSVATADPNELIEQRRINCRHCYGTGHKFQWRDMAEWADAVERATIDADRKNSELRAIGKEEMVLPKIPDCDGGFGFSKRPGPNPECTRCDGEGELHTVVKDTRTLSPSARRLYAGVKVTKEGITVLMRDQDAAMVNVAKHLGMLTDKLVLLQNLPDEQLGRLVGGVAPETIEADGTAGGQPSQALVGHTPNDPRDTAPVPRRADPPHPGSQTPAS